MLARLGRLQTISLSLFLVVYASFVPRAEAQQIEPPEYRSTIREALAEYHTRNFPEARALFTEAHRLMLNARTLRGLGMTAFELHLDALSYDVWGCGDGELDMGEACDDGNQLQCDGCDNGCEVPVTGCPAPTM